MTHWQKLPRIGILETLAYVRAQLPRVPAFAGMLGVAISDEHLSTADRVVSEVVDRVTGAKANGIIQFAPAKRVVIYVDDAAVLNIEIED